MTGPLRAAWDEQADRWIEWSRAPGHDSYWQFHRDAFLSLLPGPGRLTLDVGCGEGRVSRDLHALGHRVISLDVSRTLLRAALAAGSGAVVAADAAALPLPDAAADLVVAFMSLQDVDEFEAAIMEAGRVLEPGGRLAVAIVHPLNSAGDFEGAEPHPFVIRGSYLERFRRSDPVERDGLAMRFDSEHRPLQDYVDALAAAGLLVERLREPTEPDPADRWSRVPLFLDLVAIRA